MFNLKKKREVTFVLPKCSRKFFSLLECKSSGYYDEAHLRAAILRVYLKVSCHKTKATTVIQDEDSRHSRGDWNTQEREASI
jgi:hypothetical protein